MANTIILKLTKGRQTLDLMSGRYVGDMFTPPDINLIPNIATGTSANKYGGGTKVGETAQDREITFPILIKNCASEAEVNRALRDLRSFLSLAGDPSEPLYLEFRPNNNVVMEPLWGQYGANLRYEIVHAKGLKLTETYWVIYQGQTELPASDLTLRLKPVATGLKQRLASALGGVLQDTWGTTDGQSRGLAIRETYTNKMTNPVFGNSTWNTGWTADASLTASQNTNPMYLLPETVNSAKLVSRSTSQRFYQSINVAATTAHTFVAYIMLPDGGTPSSSDMQIFYSSALTTTFTSLGNGLWEARATATGINASTNTGVEVKSGRAIYLLAYQAQVLGADSEKIAWGDQLGVAWSGTAHASTSVVAAGRVRLQVAPDTFEISRGCFRIVIDWGFTGTTVGADKYVLDCGASNFKIYYKFSDDTLQFTDGTNTASAAFVMTPTTLDVFHFCYSPSGGLVIYRNGVSFATSATYTLPALPTYVYIGSDASAGSQLRNSTFRGFAIYNYVPTAAEVLADYTNMLPILNDGQILETIPFLWTKDGDDVVDNGDTSAKDFFAVCDGIPGSVEAKTEIYVQSSSSSAVSLNISRWDTKYFLSPSDLMFRDEGGTVDANANNGDSATRGPLGTTAAAIVSFSAMKAIQYSLLANKEIYILTRIADAGSNLTLAVELQLSSAVILTDYYPVASNASARLLRTLSLVLPSLDAVGIMNDVTLNSGFLVALLGKRSTGSANYTIDYGAIFPRPLATISPNNAGTGTIFIIKEHRCLIVDASNNTYIEEKTILGDEIGLIPGMVNCLLTLLGDTTFNPDVTLTLTYNRVNITPRWSLL